MDFCNLPVDILDRLDDAFKRTTDENLSEVSKNLVITASDFILYCLMSNIDFYLNQIQNYSAHNSNLGQDALKKLIEEIINSLNPESDFCERLKGAYGAYCTTYDVLIKSSKEYIDDYEFKTKSIEFKNIYTKICQKVDMLIKSNNLTQTNGEFNNAKNRFKNRSISLYDYEQAKKAYLQSILIRYPNVFFVLLNRLLVIL